MNNDRINAIRARCDAATPNQTRVLQNIIQSVENMLSCDDAPSMFAIGRVLRRAAPFLKQYEAAQEDRTFLLAEIDRLTEAIAKAGEMNLYKQPGNRDSYSQYNEGWQDAVNYIEASVPLPAAPKGE